LRNFSILANLCQPKIELRVDLIIRLLGFSIKSDNVESNRGKKRKKQKKGDPTLENREETDPKKSKSEFFLLMPHASPIY
jgi:hypothetical protein